MKKIILSLSILLTPGILAKNIGVIGTGYVGLVLGTGLAECGHNVVCCDIDIEKIMRLNKGQTPIFEPGLNELISKNIDAQRLFFSSSLEETIRLSEILFLAVGTPTLPDGSSDLSAVFDVVKAVIDTTTEPKILCIKSTVPLGTSRLLQLIIKSSGKSHLLSLAFNPEFLREGCAVFDFFNPDRIVVGSSNPETSNIIYSLFDAESFNNTPVIFTDTTTAEAIKYASNAFLATKVSFINEISNLCEMTGANTAEVAEGMGYDSRIGKSFLKPGPGFGGSCFPKDILALASFARAIGLELNIVESVIEANKKQKNKALNILKKFLNYDLENKKIALWGLSFKAETDDVRESPSIDLIKQLIDHGCMICAYDPMAMTNMSKIFPNIYYCESPIDAINDADALIVMTEWKEFESIETEQLIAHMNASNIIDMRGCLTIDDSKVNCCYKIGVGITKLR